MSASTAPAAVPEPNNTPSTTTGTAPQNTPAPGLLASMLAPVAPARTAAFSLAPQPADSTPATGAALPTEGVSSNGFHGDNGDQQDTNSTGTDTKTGQQPKGVVRAWLLAGAARWARGGGTQNKRLDMKKARAMAHQVKEARTVNSGSVGAGSGGGRGSNASGAAGGKSLGSKSPKGTSGSTGGGAPKGPKNSTGSGSGAGRGPSGRDTNRSADRSGSGTKPGAGGGGKGERGSSGGSSAGAKGNTSSGPKPGADGRSQSPKPPKNDTSTSTPKNSTDTKGATAPGGKSGAQGAAGTSGKNGAGNNSGSSDKPGKPTGTQKDTKPPTGKDRDSSGKTAPAQGGGTKGDTTGTDTADKRPKHSLIKKKDQTGTTPTTPGEKTTKAPDKTTEPAKTNAPADTKDAKDAKDTKPPASTADKTDGEKKPTVPAPRGGGKPFTTRPSRETGYRDGTRAARGAAHVKAYRDGVKDGYTDTIEAADREKAHLDQAHTDRKTARQETPVPLATSADHQHNTDDPTPIPVASVSKTHVFLGDGATRTSMTRGEVRNLKDLERRLEAQATSLQNRAEQTRNLKAHADEQATQATRLLEATRGAKGGDKVIGTLTRLQEAAQAQATKAEEIHKRSLRGAEHCRTTLTNVQARYGGIYQAVIDAPEHAPGELAFYEG